MRVLCDVECQGYDFTDGGPNIFGATSHYQIVVEMLYND